MAIVTGSGGGIGSEISRKLGSVGYSVIGLDLFETPGIATIKCDISEPDFPNRLPPFDNGQVSLIVHTAAYQPAANLHEIADKEWLKALQTNLLSLQKLASKFRKDLQSTRGTIIAISSIHSISTSPKMAAYAASKAALNSWVRSAAIELGPQVAVIGLAPGAIDTPKLRQGLERWPLEDQKAVLERLISKTPMGRLGSAAEVAEWVTFLASPHARFATGSTIVLDGGVSAWLGSE
ncbi:SDR family oxidoreductase [bacterium]|nr:SDR family oxidoreductase [bacterium]